MAQFLLNKDGSFPGFLSEEMRAMLEAKGVIFVVPTDRPSAIDGFHIAEGEPQNVNGIYLQTWIQTQDDAESVDSKNARLLKWRETAFIAKSDLTIALARMGLLTQDEAIAAATGLVPASFEPVLQQIAQHNSESALEARIRWAAQVNVARTNPLLLMVAGGRGITPEQLDALFGWSE